MKMKRNEIYSCLNIPNKCKNAYKAPDRKRVSNGSPENINQGQSGATIVITIILVFVFGKIYLVFGKMYMVFGRERGILE